MPGPRSCTVTLVQEVREKLEAVCRAAKSPQREVLRARMVLRASHGASNASIARELGVTADTVCKWRGALRAKDSPGCWTASAADGVAASMRSPALS